MPPGLHILYEDEACVAVCKPAGLGTQAPAQFDSVEQRLRALLAQRSGLPPGEVYLGVPHRLDRVVSGVVVFAKHRRAARRLSRQFERRRVRKHYWACVGGIVTPPQGTWRDTMRKVPYEPRSEIVPPDHPEGQFAVLHYRVLGSAAGWSWLEIELETGRMHQIRLQAATRGCPVLGDWLYGSSAPFGESGPPEGQPAIALHARSLSFVSPADNQALTITAEPPASWAAIVEA